MGINDVPTAAAILMTAALALKKSDEKYKVYLGLAKRAEDKP